MTRVTPGTEAGHPIDPADPLPGIVARIVATVPASRIVLFGSRARREARPDSDFDLLVVLPGSPDRHAETLRLIRAFRGVTTPVDLVVVGEDDLPALRSRLASVVGVALDEGQVLYAA